MASCALLMIIILSTFVFYSAKGEGESEPTPEAPVTSDPTLGTDKTLYAAGETVVFSGTGYDAGSYEIRITLSDSEIYTLSFELSEPGNIPEGVSWVIPDGAAEGTYVATSYKIITEDSTITYEIVATATFKVGLLGLSDELTGFGELVTTEVAPERVESLTASLSNAARKIEAAMALLEENEESKTAINQLRAARNMLTAFIHKVLAQSGKSIDEETASDLIEKAGEYIAYIDSMIDSTLLSTGKQLALNIQRTLQKQETHLNKFILRNSLSQIDDEQGAGEVADSTEPQIQSTIERAKGKAKQLMDLYAKGEIDHEQLEMGLEGCNLDVTMADELSGLMEEELNSRGYGTQGKRFGHYIQLARQILKENREFEGRTSLGGQTTPGASSHQLTPHGNGSGKEDGGKKDNNEDNNGKRNNGPKAGKGNHGNPH